MTWNIDSPLTAEGAIHYWMQRLDYTRNVMKKRPTYFYGIIQKYFSLPDATMVEYYGENPLCRTMPFCKPLFALFNRRYVLQIL